MGQLSGNSCNIITILPLGVDCNSVNASTPDATNGVIVLRITGGTPPYNIVWNNGLQGSPISNLLPGSYTATVTDYYGDFSATTTCEVGYDSFYLEKFEDCSTAGSFIYYLANLPSTFIVSKVYNLTSQAGCWYSSGTTLYTGQTYYNNFANTSYPPYVSCYRCLPPPVPVPVYPNNLCMDISTNNGTTTTNQQITFSSGSTVNGYPSWTSITPTYTIYYNTAMTRWETLGWVGSGIPSYNYPTAPPIGSWVVNGSPTTTVSVSDGICVAPPIKIGIDKTNPSCVGTNNGVITVSPIGGLPGYTYSINGVIYQPSSIFIGLASGNYTVYVKDSSGVVGTTSVTLTPISTVTNYVLNISLIPAAVPTNTSTTATKISYWKIEVSPTLLPTQTVSFGINFAVTSNGSSYLSTSTTVTNVITATPIGTATIGSPSTSTVTGTSTILNSGCKTNILTTSAYTTTYAATITGSGYITGTTAQSVTTPNVSSNSCVGLTGTIKNNMTININSLSPNTCSVLSNTVIPQDFRLTKDGQRG